MKKFLKIFFLSFILSSCTTLDIRIPLASIKSPELPTAGLSEVNIATLPAKLFTSTNDASKRPPIFVSTVEQSNLLNAEYNYALTDGLLIGAGANIDFGFSLQAQYQFVNSNNWLASVYGDVSYDNTQRSGDQNGTFGPGGYNWKGNLSASGIHMGTSIGYRFNEHIMSYVGFAYNSFSTKTDITQDVSNDGLDPGGSYKDSSHGNNRTIGLGVQIGTIQFNLKPAVMWTEFNLNGEKQENIVGSATLSFVFGPAPSREAASDR